MVNKPITQRQWSGHRIMQAATTIATMLATSAWPASAQIAPRNSPPRSSTGPSRAAGTRPTTAPVARALPGCGQGVPSVLVDSPPPPEQKKLGSSPGGVDMRSGTFNYQNTDVSIGGEGDAGLTLVRVFSYKDSLSTFRQAFGNFFSHNWDIQLQERRLPRAGSCYPNDYSFSETIVYGDLGESFQKQGNVGVFSQTSPSGYAEIAYTGSTASPNNFVFTARDGTVIKFSPIGPHCPGVYKRCGYAESVLRPDGTQYKLGYETLSDGQGQRLRSVVSSRGFALLFEYGSQTDGFQQTTRVCALNLSVIPKPADDICPQNVPTASYTYDGAVQTSATEAAGGVWNFGRPSPSSFSITRPGDAQPYATNSYSFVRGGNDPEPAFVIDSQQMASGQSYTYAWDILYNEDGDGANSQQVIGGKWTDAQGRSLSAHFGAYYREFPQGAAFPAYYPTPGPETVIDAIGRTTTYNYCGTAPEAGMCYIPPLRSITYPEGNVESFEYAAYNNLTGTRKVAKAGSGLPDITEGRAYAGITPTSRAKPTSTTDGRGNVTNFTYDPTHGGVLTAAGPANANGVQPVTRSGYVQRYAWLADGAGGYTPASTPVWLLAREKICRTSATSGDACSGGAGDEIVTAYDYGPDAGPNNLLLRGVTVTADGVTRRTCYGYDKLGNRISETKPRAGLASCP